MTIAPTEGTEEPHPAENGRWIMRSRCRGAIAAGEAADHEFFPDLQVDRRWEAIRDRFCVGCPVRAECFLFALEHRYIGLWGGELLTFPSLARFRDHYGIAA